MRSTLEPKQISSLTQKSKWRSALSPLVISLAWLAAGYAGAAAIGCGKPCVIEFSAGGNVLGFREQGKQLAAQHMPVIVDGPCLSACTLLVDEARLNVCITDRAVFGYHQSHSTDGAGGEHYEALEYQTPGLGAYLKSRGGQPQGVFLMVPFGEAKAFYQPCPGAG